MEQIEYLSSPLHRSDSLVILMPGAGDDHRSFESNGFIAAAHHSGISADILTVNTQYEYFSDLSIVERLHHQVVLPAISKGYRRLWMGGISLGGFAAMVYAQKQKHPLHGLVLLAPYLGNKGTLAEIQAAGGLESWAPEVSSDHDERHVWLMIKNYLIQDPNSAAVHLLFGQTDRFAAFHALMATKLDAKRVHVRPGGHDWPTWQLLWKVFLDSNHGLNAGHQSGAR
jgi:pimeloyl-ACP methyl ester carboxylesterase